MLKKQFLILINNYFSSAEVNTYLSQLDKLEKDIQIEIYVIINDNTGEFTQEITPRTLSVYTLSPNENLGYIGGCSNAYEYWIHTLKKDIPDWLMISNTDLKLPKDFLTILNFTKPNMAVLSPTVIDENQNIQNPHLMKRVNKKKIQTYIKIFSSPIYTAVYWLASTLKAKWHPPKKTQHNTTQYEIYAAHGSIFILTKEFFKKGGTFENCPFLYGEEIFIAEQNYNLKLSSIIIPSIIVIHKAHSTTGNLTLLKKRKLLLSSYKKLDQQFYN